VVPSTARSALALFYPCWTGRSDSLWKGSRPCERRSTNSVACRSGRTAEPDGFPLSNLASRQRAALFHLRLKGEMAVGYIFNPFGSLTALVPLVPLRGEGMSALISRTIESGISSIDHMIVLRLLVLLKARTRA
jgi:hypothetical protein